MSWWRARFRAKVKWTRACVICVFSFAFVCKIGACRSLLNANCWMCRSEMIQICVNQLSSALPSSPLPSPPVPPHCPTLLHTFLPKLFRRISSKRWTNCSDRVTPTPTPVPPAPFPSMAFFSDALIFPWRVECGQTRCWMDWRLTTNSHLFPRRLANGPLPIVSHQSNTERNQITSIVSFTFFPQSRRHPHSHVFHYFVVSLSQSAHRHTDKNTYTPKSRVYLLFEW